ncbi:MAG TPA: methyl-accepting chemotaxis protein [Ktedonobacterales bacterium]
MANWPPRRATGVPDPDVNRRMRQVKEMVRLGTALRAEMGLGRIFTQVVESINAAIGFRVAALNIVRSDSEFVEVVATAGLSDANQRELIQHPPRLQALIAAMRPEFCRSHSYFIPHQYRQILEQVGGVIEPPAPWQVLMQPTGPNAWDPEDVLLVPLVSPRNGRLLGVLSLDQPEDGAIPSLETIEIIELFANQAALAIDTSRLFAEREQERQMLAQGLRRLRYHLDMARNRDLRLPAPPLNSALDPLVVSLNEVLDTFNAVLAEAQAASEMVNQHASEVRAAATYLSEGSAEQAERILELSTAVDGMSQNVRHIAATASQSSVAAREASELSRAGSESTALASEGMARVRELTLQTKKKVKRLGESAQEIGDIVQLVTDIAAQTNLLALNASIEAARAGEHGRGFAVVAQEIRHLATNASDATRQISSHIQGVQNETHQVVVQIEHSVEQVVLQSEFVTQAGAALAEVDKLNQRLANDVQQINDIASEQARVATQVATVIKDLAGVSTETSDSMQQARASMDYLVELAETLQRQISSFRLRDGAEATNTQLAVTTPSLGAPQASTLTTPQAALLTGRLQTDDGAKHPATTTVTMPPQPTLPNLPPVRPAPATQPGVRRAGAVPGPRGVPTPPRLSALTPLEDTTLPAIFSYGASIHPLASGPANQPQSGSGGLDSGSLDAGDLSSGEHAQAPTAASTPDATPADALTQDVPQEVPQEVTQQDGAQEVASGDEPAEPADIPGISAEATDGSAHAAE